MIIQFLHLSDIHCGYDNYTFDNLRESMPDKIAEFAKNNRQKIEYIFITGDLEYGINNPDEYPHETIEFIHTLQNKLGIKKEHTFVIPGNHDVTKNFTRISAINIIKAQYSSEKGIVNDEYIEALSQTMRQFKEIYHDICGRDYKENHFCINLDPVNVIHLNTSLICGTDNEDGSLIIGMSLLKNALKNMDIHKPSIVLAHHCFDCLIAPERQQLEKLLKSKNAILYLCGHKHVTTFSDIFESSKDRHLWQFACGTSMDDTNHNIFLTNMGFFIGMLDTEKCSGYIDAYKWSNRGYWMPDSDFSYSECKNTEGRIYFPSHTGVAPSSYLKPNRKILLPNPSDHYKEKQSLVDKVVQQLSICSDMLGPRDDSKYTIYNFIPGINEVELQDQLEDKIKSIRQGLYQVMFTGAFNSGKSTLINALMRSDLLPMSVLPETAVITEIIFNDPNERAEVYKKELDDQGNRAIEVIWDIPSFFKKYSNNPWNTGKFKDTVDHVVLYQKKEGLAGSMVQLVDSPGTTNASVADDEVSMNYLKKADAIIFVIDATCPLSKYEKEYIKKYFVGHQLRNIFFVVNKIDVLISDYIEEKLKQYIRLELTSVFTDQNGVFNEELYRKRVFFVNAFGSMNARLGKEIISQGRILMISDNETGVPEFEMSLEEFLTSSDKDKAALNSYLCQMADYYIKAERSIQKQLNDMRKGTFALKEIVDSYEQSKHEIHNTIKEIEKKISMTSILIIMDAKEEYNNYIDRIEKKWDDYFSKKSDEMGVSTMKLLEGKILHLIQLWKDKSIRDIEFEKSVEDAMKPFTDRILEFMVQENEALSVAVISHMEDRFNVLESNLNTLQSDIECYSLPININQLIRDISLEGNTNIPTSENKLNMGQAIIAILLNDPELLESSKTGNVRTLSFLMDIIKTNVLDFVTLDILSLVFTAANPLGLVLTVLGFLTFKLIKREIRKEDATKLIIKETKEKILNGYIDEKGVQHDGLKYGGKRKYIATLEQKIGGSMNRAGEYFTTKIKTQLTATERQLKDALSALEQDENAYKYEQDRTRAVLDTFSKSISNIGQLVNNKLLTVEDIKKLSSFTDDPMVCG